MSDTGTTGLFLGKFAPLHSGHQMVIETALDEVDELITVVYDVPETTNTPLTVRADWIRDLYPDVEVLEAWTGPTETGYTEEIKRTHEEYIDDLLGDRDVTHFYSSEPYGAHMSEALDAVDRRIDMARTTVPISGTAIRDDPYGNRDFVDDRVYRDLVTNIVFLGGPSTGKSTIAERMAQEHDTEWMPEYGREYWTEHNVDRRLTQDQLLAIAHGHREREDAKLAEANGYLFMDTNAITTREFARYYHGASTDELDRLARECGSRYDVTFLCDTDIPYDDTWDRSGPGNRERLQKQTKAFLDRHNIPYHVLSGDVEERVAQVNAVLDDHEQYDACVT